MFSHFAFKELCTSNEIFASAECRMYMHVSIAPHRWLYSYAIEDSDRNLFAQCEVHMRPLITSRTVNSDAVLGAFAKLGKSDY